MRAVEIVFIVGDDEVDALNAQIEASGLLNEWPVYSWTDRETKTYEDNWHRDEYAQDDELVGPYGNGTY